MLVFFWRSRSSNVRKITKTFSGILVRIPSASKPYHLGTGVIATCSCAGISFEIVHHRT
ncbi:hypothetical protein [Nostoc sp.]|uniref:hypothetical protein n=1 Tax=Nostoc sp. TaxID=1180 RepID=UPI002FFBC4C0